MSKKTVKIKTKRSAETHENYRNCGRKPKAIEEKNFLIHFCIPPQLAIAIGLEFDENRKLKEPTKQMNAILTEYVRMKAMSEI